MTDSQRFYDDYVGRQVAVGENARHHAILAFLRRSGMRPSDRVLEIGCGVGTLTRLLATALDAGGTVVGTDLSPKSIDAARERLAEHANTELVVGDVLAVEIAGPFDIVVLPDVIEHIPLELHPALFRRVAEWLAEGGAAVLNFPNPHYLEWCHVHTPEVLQSIDQPIHADVLTANVYPSGLYLQCLETYSVWVREGDYVRAVLRRGADARTFSELPERPHSALTRLVHRIKRPGG